ncbi:MAG TPA: ABC transporter permease [Syntrophales bacterium]|nr:ABC transporter permease [Syntrophales bacterium]HOX93242.1 ABC transporter permease [Syntrophales bacterium]HPI56284.1 ABC transporter permease [Syntrophales bacterium]HPN24471.1 ABC transporter permease [Syntrophales bacterium]HQM29101.1 ABC transporter permease [Syntrophales bacterium]
MIDKRLFGISRRFLHVWKRNLTVYRKNWKISFLPPILEPLFYLLAFGVGLSALVGSIQYRGSEISYIAFIAPALISINIMYNAFFETTYSSFVRMYYQKTFDAMMATPLFIGEVITGEIVWGATKSMIATLIMLGVISLFGLIDYPAGLVIIPLSFLGGLAFGAIGMYFTSIVSHIDIFNLPIFLFITPMFLFSGTFFPLETLPAWAQQISYVLPLTHLVSLVRALSFGVIEPSLALHVLYLVVFTLVFSPWSLVKMQKRLIK